MKGFYEAMQQKTLRLTPPVARPMPIVIPSYNGARKQANLTLCWPFCCISSVFRWCMVSVTIRPGADGNDFELMGIPATRHAGQAQARLDGHEPVYIPVGVLCPPLENSPCAGVWRTQQRTYTGKAGDAIF